MIDQEILYTPSDPEIQEIAEEVHKIMNNEFEISAGTTWKSLVLTAQFFIQRCDKLSSFNISMSQFDLLKNAMNLVKRSNQQLVLIQASYAYAFWFDEKLKQFREQVPSSALFVLDTKKGPVTYELPMVSLIKYVNAADKNRLNASSALLQKELDGVKKEDVFDIEHVTQAQAAYNGVSNRLERYWSKSGSSQRQDGLLLWKEGREWVVAKVLNKGDLREAYAAALMSEHKSKMDKLCGIPAGSPDFYSHDLIKVFFNEHISKVSNAAAIQEEDIIMPNKQYGVKSFRAELPSLNQYYEAAQWILKNKDATKEELETELRKGGEAFRNKILGTFNAEVNENIDKLLDKINSQFGKK